MPCGTRCNYSVLTHKGKIHTNKGKKQPEKKGKFHFHKSFVYFFEKISPCQTPTAMLSSQAKTNGVSKLTEIYKVPSLELAWNLHLKPFAWNLLLETLEPPTTFAWNPYIFGTWELFLGTVACLEPSLKIFGLEPWNLGTSCILKLELLEVSPGTCLEPFNHDKPKPSYMEQCWNLKTPATFQNLLGTAEPLGTSTWNLEPFDTFWNLHLEPVLETRNLYWMLAWNFRAFRNLAFTWNPLLEPLLGTLTWNLGTWNLLEFWNFPEPFLGSLSCLEPSLETWPWTSTWTP